MSMYNEEEMLAKISKSSQFILRTALRTIYKTLRNDIVEAKLTDAEAMLEFINQLVGQSND